MCNLSLKTVQLNPMQSKNITKEIVSKLKYKLASEWKYAHLNEHFKVMNLLLL